jgi:predicted DNA-binding mobile mystery protein A
MSRKNTAANAAQARISLDSRLEEMQAAAGKLSRPRAGWIHSIRVGLGMSVADLAKRLSVAPSTVVRMEASEAAGTINIDSLVKAARALDCELVYALVPRQELIKSRERRASSLARLSLMRTQNTMSLEQQSLSESVLERMIEAKTMELMSAKNLWSELHDPAE